MKSFLYWEMGAVIIWIIKRDTQELYLPFQVRKGMNNVKKEKPVLPYFLTYSYFSINSLKIYLNQNDKLINTKNIILNNPGYPICLVQVSMILLMASFLEDTASSSLQRSAVTALLYWYFFRNKWIPLLTKNILKFK